MKHGWLFITLVLLVSCCTGAFAQLSYEGSSSMGEQLIPDLAKAYEAKAGVKFDRITANDSDLGFKAVMEGKALLGGLSRMLKEEELKQNFMNQVVGYDAIAIYVNKDNPVRNLTVEQIRKIFAGDIKNWKDVGGPDAKIVTVSRKGEEGGSSRHFLDIVMEGKPPAAPTLEGADRGECVKKVVENKDAITYASIYFRKLGAEMCAVNGVLPEAEKLRTGEYVISRPFNLIYKEADDQVCQKFVDFVFTEEGQKIVASYVMPVIDFSETK
ncbi:MAG TPA: phosphate ABC transporter substrate-binding protein [Candidatus Ozemobacteraceae bacterium]|nr:phosphate ABC transporter substrate-binding protein [Candidatus Ozemobacteraceae bacterium]